VRLFVNLVPAVRPQSSLVLYQTHVKVVHLEPIQSMVKSAKNVHQTLIQLLALVRALFVRPVRNQLLVQLHVHFVHLVNIQSAVKLVNLVHPALSQLILVLLHASLVHVVHIAQKEAQAVRLVVVMVSSQLTAVIVNNVHLVHLLKLVLANVLHALLVVQVS